MRHDLFQPWPPTMTAVLRAFPAQAYLTWAFDRLGTHRDLFALPLEEMTPAAFKKTLA